MENSSEVAFTGTIIIPNDFKVNECKKCTTFKKDSKTIQDSLDEAQKKGGGIVFIDPGVYEITETIKIASNIKLIGLGKVIFKRMANISAILTNKTDGVKGVYSANENIQVENIKFDGNNLVYDSNMSNVAFGHCSNVSIINCIFDSCATFHELEINGCFNVKIENCTFQGYTGTSEVVQLDYMGSEGQFPWFGPYDNTPCKNVTIKNCTFLGSSFDGIGSHTAIAGMVHQSISIINNKFLGLQRYCIRAYNYSDVSIEGNIFENCFQGISVASTGEKMHNYRIVNNVMQNMQFSNADSTGIAINANINDGVILNNQIKDCGKHGLFIGTTDWQIIGNIIKDCGVNGAYLYTASDVMLANNRFVNNNKKNVAGANDLQVLGTSAATSNNTLIQGNKITKLGLTYTNNSLVVGNIFEFTPILGTGNTNQQVLNNLIITQ